MQYSYACMHPSIHQFINASIYLSHPSHLPIHPSIQLVIHLIYPASYLFNYLEEDGVLLHLDLAGTLIPTALHYI